ncbi:MAG: response regulator [Anaerolineales bacterium]|nr:response regulator [Anaerolineales bacterium]
MAKILLVDDENEMLDVWNLFLRHSGHEVLKAHDGAEALEIAQTFLPDLIILDLMMPMASGDMVLGIIRSTPSLANTKVLVVSAHPKGAKLAVDLGADGYLAKPVHLDQFKTEVNRLVPY